MDWARAAPGRGAPGPTRASAAGCWGAPAAAAPRAAPRWPKLVYVPLPTTNNLYSFQPEMKEFKLHRALGCNALDGASPTRWPWTATRPPG